jgi:hypothetical protein
MKVQNDREKPIDAPLAICSTVYIRSLKIQNKLKPIFHGPYTVSGRTNNGNYIENRRGTKLRQTYPISHLKTVESEEDEVLEVDQIVDNRKRSGKLEYFVKWKDLPVEENSWVKEQEFVTAEIIDEYWDNITLPAKDDDDNILLCHVIDEQPVQQVQIYPRLHQWFKTTGMVHEKLKRVYRICKPQNTTTA